MERNNNDSRAVVNLIGDFYESSACKDRVAMNRTLDYMENLIGHGEADSIDILKYFNEVFSGRTAYNTLINVKDYPAESIVRELLQNAFDCCYNNREIKLAVNFKNDNLISFAYNETGFTLENFLYYLSFGQSNGNSIHREGRFGVGAKSVFKNVEWLSMRSNNISFRIVNNNGSFRIKDLNLCRPNFSGTEIVIKVDKQQYDNIFDNLSDLTKTKGVYINIPELCFAFNKKKVLNYKTSPNEDPDRSFNIAILKNGEFITVYKIIKHCNISTNVEVLRFSRNNKNVVDFICHEHQGFTYLIPFAVSNNYKSSVLQVLTEKYNYFSTYELTGRYNSERDELNEKLSAFFISIPNHFITTFRTGIRLDSQNEVSANIESGLLNLISEYRKYFVLVIGSLPDNSDYCYIRPDSYVFEFLKNFMMTSQLTRELKNKFQINISLHFKDENLSLLYSEIIKTAYTNSVINVTEEEHRNGTAYTKYIENELRQMREILSNVTDKTLHASYTWDDSENNYSETIFCYEFYVNGKSFVVDSRVKPSTKDFNLAYHFTPIISYIINQSLGGDASVKDENGFISLIKVLDEKFGENYKITLNYPNFYINAGGEEYRVSVSEMRIVFIADLMEKLAYHRYRFAENTDYTGTEKLFLDIFSKGRDTVDVLKSIKSESGIVSLRKNWNDEYCFFAYGSFFQITDDMSFDDLTELSDNPEILFESGLLKRRFFSPLYQKGRYNFEKEKIIEIFKSEHCTEIEIEKKLNEIFISDLKAEKIALLNAGDIIIDIVDNKINYNNYDGVIRFVILNTDLSKEQFTDAIEIVICGESNGVLNKALHRAKQTNLILTNPIPYSERICDVSNFDVSNLREYIKNTNEKYHFYAADTNSGLPGYGGFCSVCGYTNDAINCFGVKEFNINTMHEGAEKYFLTSLHLCANCFILTDAWVMENLEIDNTEPFKWLNKVKRAGTIPSELLRFKIEYREQTSNKIPVSDEEEYDSITLSPKKLLLATLTPQMLAKWIEDNIPFFHEK